MFFIILGVIAVIVIVICILAPKDKPEKPPVPKIDIDAATEALKSNTVASAKIMGFDLSNISLAEAFSAKAFAAFHMYSDLLSDYYATNASKFVFHAYACARLCMYVTEQVEDFIVVDELTDIITASHARATAIYYSSASEDIPDFSVLFYKHISLYYEAVLRYDSIKEAEEVFKKILFNATSTQYIEYYKSITDIKTQPINDYFRKLLNDAAQNFSEFFSRFSKEAVPLFTECYNQ